MSDILTGMKPSSKSGNQEFRKQRAARRQNDSSEADLEFNMNWLPQKRQLKFLKACGLSHPFSYYLDRRDDDKPKIFRIPPEERQTEYQPPEARIVGYGGAAGGGKSDSMLVGLFVEILSNPGAKCGYFRRKYSQLEGAGGAIMRSKELFSDFPGAKWNGKNRRWTFESLNGGIIEFCHANNEDDVYNYQSQQFDAVAFDEATQFTRFQYRYIMSRNRVTVKGVAPLVMMGTNPGGIGHCVPYGEVLTKKGWKDIKDVEINDKVLSLNKNRDMIYKTVKQKHKHKYQGKMFKYENSILKITATPEHRIARKIGDTPEDSRFKLEKIKDIPDYSYIVRKGKYYGGKEIESFKIQKMQIRKLKNKQPLEISGDNYCKLMGWFLSEGHTNDRDKCFGISQSKHDNKNEIRQLLKDIGFKYSEKDEGFIVYSAHWWNYLKQFGKCTDKFVPRNILNATKRQLQIFFNTMVKGDGHVPEKGNRIYYYSLSEKLAKQMSEIGIKLGYVITFNDRLRKNRDYRSYEVRFKYQDKVADGEILKKNSKYIDYSGYVYDIGVEDTHNFFIRQDDTVWVSGNSWFKKEFVDIGEFEKPHEVEVAPGVKEKHMFIPAYLKDNIILNDRDEGYEANLMGLNEIERKRLLEGDWDIHAGQFFPKFDRNIHVIDSFEIPDYWRRFISIDYGLDMSAVYWYALDNEGFYYVYKELYRPNLSLSDLAVAIHEKTSPIERDVLSYTVASPDLWNRRQETGKSGRQILAENGLSGYALRKADDRRVEGWRVVREYLKPIDDPMHDGEGEPKKVARVRIFGDRVRKLQSHLPALQHDDDNPDDVSDTPHDITHAPESFRYFCMSRPPLRSMTPEDEKRSKRRRSEIMAGRNKYTGY